MQRAVYGVDFATDAGPVSVLQDPAGPTRAGLCHTLEKDLNNSSVQTAPLRFCTNNNIYSPATFFFWKTIKCFLCNFFCGCGYGNLGWGHMDKSTLHPPPFLSPLARRLLILSHHFSAWHFYYSAINAVKLCRVVAYFCVRLPLLTTSTPILPGWGIMINYSGASFFFFNLILLESLSYLAYARSPHCLESAGDSRRETGCTIKRGKCKSFSARTSKRF